MTERCLQERIGSCRGCNVLEIIRNRINRDNKEKGAAAKEIAGQYCPEGARPQIYLISETKIPGMGQGYSSLVRIE